ncbi:MAG: response regulator [Vicinamibacterales bacterium]
MNPVRIILADDHPIFLSGLHAVLDQSPDIVVVDAANDGDAALLSIVTHQPDIAVLDLDMPKRDGFAVAAELDARGLDIPIVFLTMHRTERLVNRAFDAGVKGFVVKDAASNEIVDCIRTVHAGQHYVSPQLSTWLVNRNQRAQALALEKPGLSGLTKAERRVLELIGDQHSSKAIADALFISVRTVDRHRANICAKLDLRGVNALTKFAIAWRSSL